MTGAAAKFETLGCRLNSYETEAMREMAAAAGISDSCVVNTCAVTAEAVRKSRQAIRRQHRENPSVKVLVTGCAAQIDPEGFARMPEVDVVIGNSRKMLPETWRGLADSTETERSDGANLLDDIMAVRKVSAPAASGPGANSRAYVQVQNGCDHRCTFCIIPYGRGNSRSVSADAIVAQVKALAAKGYREVVLTGVDITCWGNDLAETPKLGNLMARILKLVPEIDRLRVSSVDPVEIDREFMEVLAENPRLMPHLHLSLQSGDNMILKRMKRRHSREDAIGFCEEARKLRPDIMFGADMIAGFPTESDEMFRNSVELVEECGLAMLHVFPFSPRSGTPAARMPQVPGNIVRERASELRAAGRTERLKQFQRLVGKNVTILMESESAGRTEHFADAEIDTAQTVGSIIRGRVSGLNGSKLSVSGLGS